MSHSPLPWGINGGSFHFVYDAANVIVMDNGEHPSKVRKDDMEFIIETVNQHYELLDTLARFKQDSEQFKMGQEDERARILNILNKERDERIDQGLVGPYVSGIDWTIGYVIGIGGNLSKELPRPYDEVKAERDKYKDIVDKVAEIVIRSDTTRNDDWQDITVLLTEQGYELIFTGDQ